MLDTAEKVLDGTEGPPPASVASALEEISLESLVSILSRLSLSALSATRWNLLRRANPELF